MAEKVGEIYYQVTLDTAEMVQGQRRIDRELNKTSGSLESFGAKIRQITAAVSAYVAATYLVGQADAYTKLNAQLKLATDGHVALAAAQRAVRDIAQEAQADISAVGVLYARITNSTKELGVSQRTVGEITRAVSLSMKISGASAQESSSAMLQLSQAFASGVLRGEEFNSVSEASPRLMKALADGLGVPIGKLREMAAEGELTSQVLASALPKALRELEQEAKSVQTISGSFQELRNEVMLFVGELSAAVGGAEAVSSAVSAASEAIKEMTTSIKDGGLTEYFDKLKPVIAVAEVAVISLAGALTARLVAAMASVILQAGWAAAAMVTMNTAAATFGTVLAGLGGPIGLAITAVALLALNWDKLGFSAKTAADISEDAASRIAASLGKSDGAAKRELSGQLAEAQAEVMRLEAAKRRERTIYNGRGSDATIAEIDGKIATYKKAIADIQNAQVGLSRRGEDALRAGAGPRGGAGGDYTHANPNMSKWLDKYATDAERLNKELAKAKKELGSDFTPELEGRIRSQFAKKNKGATFDEDGYIAGLRKAQATEMEAINITEQEELRKLESRKLGHKAYEEAKTLITLAAEQDRAELMLKAQEKIDKDRKEFDRKAEADRDERDRRRMAAREAIAASNPVDAVRLEEEQKLAAIEEYRQIDLENTRLYEDAKLAIKQQTAERIKEIENDLLEKQQQAQLAQFQGYSSLFGSVADLTKTFAGEQSGAYRAMFAVSKAFAIAESIIKIQQGIANAAALPFPANLGAMATVAASTAGIISTISGTNFGGGRQYGGPVSAGTMYRVNEGGKPEMFTASNGTQYMMPTASGKVTSAAKATGPRVGNIVQNITVGQGVTPQQMILAMTAAKQEIMSELYQSNRRGGAFS